MATAEGTPLQGDWNVQGAADLNFLRAQLLKGCRFPDAVYRVVENRIVEMLADKKCTKRTSLAVGKFLNVTRQLDLAAFKALDGSNKPQVQEVHYHQGTEVNVHGPAALVCPPEVAAKLRQLPDDVIDALVLAADQAIEEGESDVSGSDPAAA
jgi:hypothetical protein